MSLYREFEPIVVRVSEDSVKPDPELWCWACETHLCDVEHDDGLDTLARVAATHLLICDKKELSDAHHADG